MNDQGKWATVIQRRIKMAIDTAPTAPGPYRLPCGECFVDFFLTPEGDEVWLVPGDQTAHTRMSVAVRGHGEHAWERMYTLADAAAEIRRRAAEELICVSEVLDGLVTERADLASAGIIGDRMAKTEHDQPRQGSDAKPPNGARESDR